MGGGGSRDADMEGKVRLPITSDVIQRGLVVGQQAYVAQEGRVCLPGSKGHGTCYCKDHWWASTH